MSQRYTYPKCARILNRCHFKWHARNSQQYAGKSVIIEFSKIRQKGATTPLPHPKMGITVTKKFGKAHERNRFKRIVREAYRLCYQQIPLGLQLVVKPKTLASSKTGNVKPKLKTQDILFDFLGFVNRVGS